MTEVRVMKLSELREKGDALSRAVSLRRREKASRFLREDDRLRCLAAGYLAEKHLPGWSESRLYTGKDGKPFLEGGVPFSLSHGGDYIVLAWCAGAEGVGVDVEPVRDMGYYRDILPCAMSVRERKSVGGNAEKAVRVWTRKESLYKCVGEGFSDFSSLPEVLEDRVLFMEKPCRFRSWEETGHVFSVAVLGLDEPVRTAVRPVSFCP